jgi:hypothetical protein
VIVLLTRPEINCSNFDLVNVVTKCFGPLCVAVTYGWLISVDFDEVLANIFTRYPNGLISALKKIKGQTKQHEKKVNKTIAPLFFSSPFKGLSKTHPPLEKRIDALKRM